MRNILISFLILFGLMGNLHAESCKNTTLAGLLRADMIVNYKFSDNTEDGFSVTKEPPSKNILKDDKTTFEYGTKFGVFDKCIRLNFLGRDDSLTLNMHAGYGDHLFFDRENEEYTKRHKTNIKFNLEYKIPLNH